MGLIYMRISPSGKCYIGQTIKNEASRWQEHCYEAFNPKHPNYNSKLNKAIRKYGADNFSSIILETCQNEDMDNREQYWINFYNSYYNGYNSTLGGGGGQKYTDQDILTLWEQGLNQKQISDKLSCNRTTINDRIITLISKEKRDERHDETAANKLSQEEYNNILNLWNEGCGIKEIQRKTQHDRKVISNFLKKNGISSEEIQTRGKELSIKSRKTRHIAQYDTEGKCIRVFNSMKEAMTGLQIYSNQTIDKIIAGRSTKYKNIILKNIEE